jgi:hypothetical protein
MEFLDRLLTCADCGGEFVFTAGEQLFFLDKQFKNDPKRCKPCKSRRSGLVAAAAGSGPAAAGLSRTETRTECSECGIVTQGRPVLCRQCFKTKRVPNAASQETVAASAQLVAAGSMAQGSERVQVAPDASAGAQSSLA